MCYIYFVTEQACGLTVVAV